MLQVSWVCEPCKVDKISIGVSVIVFTVLSDEFDLIIRNSFVISSFRCPSNNLPVQIIPHLFSLLPSYYCIRTLKYLANGVGCLLCRCRFLWHKALNSCQYLRPAKSRGFEPYLVGDFWYGKRLDIEDFVLNIPFISRWEIVNSCVHLLWDFIERGSPFRFYICIVSEDHYQ